MRRLILHRFKLIARIVKRSVFLNKYFPGFKSPVYWKGDLDSFARAGFVGCFFMMLPIPFQMLMSSIFAYLFKANIPLATALAWITNPLTMIPIWYSGYGFGAWLLDSPKMASISEGLAPLSYGWFEVVFPVIWIPLYVGNIILGIIIGLFLYSSIKFFPLLKSYFLTIHRKSN